MPKGETRRGSRGPARGRKVVPPAEARRETPPQRAEGSKSAPFQEDDAAEPIPVVVVGLGTIGRAVVAAALAHAELRVVSAADPARAGVKLSTLVAGAPDVEVARDAASAYRAAPGGVALLCTVSELEAAVPQLEEALAAGLSVVSSCEELAHAAFVDPELAARIDAAARRAGRSVLGTGVNPGFVLDRLVATLAGACGRIRHVAAGRVIDALSRREALQRKVGAGLSVGEFDRRAEEGEIGHVGLAASCALLAEGLALAFDEVEEEIEPLVAEAPVAGAAMPVPAGAVRGARQVARAFDEGREVVRLELTIALGANEPRDWAEIDAEPRLSMVLPGGTPGEPATAWALVNAAPRVAVAEPGLLTVMDLPAGR